MESEQLCSNSTYYTMELAALVTLRLTTVVLGLSSTELAKILNCLGYNVLVQFHLNPPQLFAYQGKLVIMFRECKIKIPTADTTSTTRSKRDT